MTAGMPLADNSGPRARGPRGSVGGPNEDTIQSNYSTITFPITLDYWSSWTLPRAISECVANAFDEVSSIQFSWEDGWLTIADDGPGLPRQGLLLGFSTKRGNSKKLGQFGEGLCVAMATCARTNTEMIVETAGYSVRPNAVDDPDLGARVLQVVFGPSSRMSGTVVPLPGPRKDCAARPLAFPSLRSGVRSP